MKSFLLIDSHIAIRSALKELLLEIFERPEIHEAGDTESALENLNNYQYDLIVMDIKILKAGTLDLMELIHDNYRDVKVVIFSMHPVNVHGKRFIEAGALGFISKGASLEEITRMINLVVNEEAASTRLP